MPKNTTKKAAIATEAPVSLADAVFEASLEAIRDEINSLRGKKTYKGPHDKVSRIAWLAKNAAAIAAEQRKAKTAELRANQNITDAQLMAYFKALTKAARANWIRDLSAMDRNPGVFG